VDYPFLIWQIAKSYKLFINIIPEMLEAYLMDQPIDLIIALNYQHYIFMLLH